MRAGLLLAALLLPAAAAAAPPAADATAWMGVKGATAERVREDVFGGNLMLYRAGKRGAEPVLLVHGLNTDGARDWSRVVPALAPSYDVYALDLPGFGQSDKGNQLYTPDNMARAIEQAVAPRIGRPFVLVGHSMGGAISLGYAAAYPRRLRRLVLVDMAGVLHGGVYGQSLAKYGLGQLATGVPRDAPWVDTLLKNVMTKIENMPMSPDVVLRTPGLREKILRGDPLTIAGFALGQHDFSAALRSITTPTLLVWGSDDEVAPLRTGQLAEALIPGARLEVIPGAAHSPMLEDPARFNAILLDELAHGRPRPALAAATGPIGGTAQKCDGKERARFSGDIPSLTLIQCKGAQISNARIGELRVLESDVRVLNSEIRGGIYALRSQVELTAGVVAGAPALKLEDSDVDAAGTRFEGPPPVAENAGQTPLTVRLSVVELRLPGLTPRYVHEPVRLAPGARW